MKYQKRNKSRIRENENNTLLDNDLGKQKEKKTKKKEKIPGAHFHLKKTGCEGYLNQENKDAVM